MPDVLEDAEDWADTVCMRAGRSMRRISRSPALKLPHVWLPQIALQIAGFTVHVYAADAFDEAVVRQIPASRAEQAIILNMVDFLVLVWRV